MLNSLPSVGKQRGLSATSTPEGVFNILAFDHRQSFVKMLNPLAPEAVPYADVVAAKSDVVLSLAPHASAVLLDPVYGAAQVIASGALPGQVGLLVAIEESGYTGSDEARRSSLLAGWSVAQARRMGASAVKFLVFYHPWAGELTAFQEDMISAVIHSCREVDLTLFLEPISYSNEPGLAKNSAGFAAQLPGIMVEIARRLGALGPDVLKLEFPVNAAYDSDEASWVRACQAISEASPCPWTVLSAGVDFEIFTRQVEIACLAGASGYIAGRSLWKDGIPLPSAERVKFMSSVVAGRLDHLAEITSRCARPWRDFYPDLADSVQEGWYLSYRG